jgi:hypothetical protein
MRRNKSERQTSRQITSSDFITSASESVSPNKLRSKQTIRDVSIPSISDAQNEDEFARMAHVQG